MFQAFPQNGAGIDLVGLADRSAGIAQLIQYYLAGPCGKGDRFNQLGGEDGLADGIAFTAGQVQPKYFNNNANFEFGFVTPNDDWNNYWRQGQNEFLGWDTTR